MDEIMVLLILSICLALLAAFLLICYSDYRRTSTSSDTGMTKRRRNT